MRNFGINKRAAAPAEGAAPQAAQAAAAEQPAAGQDMDSYIQQRIEEIDAQAAAFQKQNPDFDMRREIQDPVFSKYVWGNGLTVEEAYFLTHREEILSQAQETAAAPAGARRIDENGAGKNRPAMTKKNPRDMSDDEIDEIISRVRRGETVKL